MRVERLDAIAARGLGVTPTGALLARPDGYPVGLYDSEDRLCSQSPAALVGVGEALVDEPTAIEPSPTAEATRLIEPEWTSPTAKIPGRLVSRKAAGRRRTRRGRRRRMSRPVSRNPASSVASWPSSHSVCGEAPMKTNSARAASSSTLARPVVGDRHGLQLTLAVELDDLGCVHDLDRVVALDLVDEVARHRLAEIAAADQ